MADLSTLDATKPLPGDLVSEGDDRIRETRVAVLTSFAVEHALGGVHKLRVGNAASRPAAGNVGRIYLNTENEWIEYDTGVVFNHLHALNAQIDSDDSATLTSTVVGVQTTLASLNIVTRSNSHILAIATATAVWTLGTPSAAMRATLDGVAMTPEAGTSSLLNGTTNVRHQFNLFSLETTPLAAGTHVLNLEGTLFTGVGSSVSWDDIRLVGIVF